MDIEELRVRCIEYRKKLGFTQKDVADELGCSMENISAFENARNNSGKIWLWYISKGLFDKEDK